MRFLSNLNPYAQIHIAVILFGFTAVFGRLIDLSEGVLVWYRMLFASISMIAILYAQKKMVLLPKDVLLKSTLIGFILTLHWLTFYGAVKYSNVSVTLSCFASCPLFTSLLEPLMSDKRFSWKEMLLGLFAMFGIYLVFRFQELYLTGIILALISSVLSALFTILNKKLVANNSPLILSTYEITTGVLLLTLMMPFYLWLFPTAQLIPSFIDTIYLLILSLLCTTIAFTLSLKALQKLSSYTVNLSVNLEPIYGILLAFFIFHENEELNSGFYIGTAIILSTVFIQVFIDKVKMNKMTLLK